MILKANIFFWILNNNRQKLLRAATTDKLLKYELNLCLDNSNINI